MIGIVRERSRGVAGAKTPHAATTQATVTSGRYEQLIVAGAADLPVDEIVRQSGVSSGDVQLVLLELDLAGRLDRHAGGKVSLRAA